ncbi:OprO/OprP family phosphate-selective porin [Pseudomonadota bacterium]
MKPILISGGHFVRAFALIAPFFLQNPGLANSNLDKTDNKNSNNKPWQPAFVGGVQGPLLGFGYNGFLQTDGATFLDDSSGQFEDGVNLRRARLTFARKISEQWEAKGSAEFARGDIEIKDLYGRYNGLSFATLQFGNQKEPFSLQHSTSSRFTNLMERSMVVNALAPGRNIGITMLSSKANMTGMIGIFSRGFKQDNLTTSGDGVTGRTTLYRMIGGQHILHGGLSASYRSVGSTPPRYRSRPETGINDTYMIDTGDLNQAENVGRLGLETTYVNGPLSLQGEYIVTRVRRGEGLDNLTFDGWYFIASWFLTGESRTYFNNTGTFGRVFPSSPFTLNGGRGAWELAFRVSRADLSDKEIIGGVEKNISFGLNWFLREYVVVMANYIKVIDVDRPGSEFDNNTMNIFQLRLQLEF